MLKVTKVTLSHEGSGAIAMAALNFVSLKNPYSPARLQACMPAVTNTTVFTVFTRAVR